MSRVQVLVQKPGTLIKFVVFLNPSKKKVGIVPEIRSRPLSSTPFPVYHSGYEGPNLKDKRRILVTFCIAWAAAGFSLNKQYINRYKNEDSSLLVHDAVSTGTQLLMFRRNLLPPSSEYTRVLGKPSNCRVIKWVTTYPLTVSFAEENDNGKVLY